MNFYRFHECGKTKIPTVFSLTGGSTVGIFAFMVLCIQTRFFSLWVQMHKRAGIVKGLQVPLLLGFQ